jgi:hypothetical protein
LIVCGGTVTAIPEKPTISAREVLPPLLIGVLGTASVIVYYFATPRLQILDVVLLLVVVAFATLGAMQNIIRGLMTLFALYFATGLAATFYQIVFPYISSILRNTGLRVVPVGSVDYDALAFSFGLLTVVMWIALEAIARLSLPDSSLPALGIFDTLGGALIYLSVGILTAALIFNTFGYSTTGWDAHYRARLRPKFNQVVRFHYTTQAFWFPAPPLIYTYDLDL